jgi:hypothetical protein
MTTTESIPDRIPPMLASSARPFDDDRNHERPDSDLGP